MRRRLKREGDGDEAYRETKPEPNEKQLPTPLDFTKKTEDIVKELWEHGANCCDHHEDSTYREKYQVEVRILLPIHTIRVCDMHLSKG